jgi:hypothetical protein
MTEEFCIKCKWCNKNRGVIKNILLCPRCDYTEAGGPPCNDVKDVNPKP